MKYIKTKDGRILKVFKDNVSLFQENDGVSYCGKETVDFETSCFLPKSLIIKQADSIEELFDEFRVTGYTTIPKRCDVGTRQLFGDKSKYLSIELNSYGERYCCDLMTFLKTKPKCCIFGAIWIKGEHDEPILKSVAKMKGILPNGEIDWELL